MDSQTVRDEAVVGIARPRRRKQSGYVTLIGMLMALALAIGALPWVIEMQERDREADRAEKTGKQLAQISAGLNQYMSEIQSGEGHPEEINSLAPLRPESCEPAEAVKEEGFIPCHVASTDRSDTYLRGDYEIQLIEFGADDEGIEVQLLLEIENPRNPDRRAAIAQYVANEVALSQESASAGFYDGVYANIERDVFDGQTPVSLMDPEDLYRDVDGNLTVEDANNHGRLLMVLSNRATDDRWLRVDGTNQMEANLDAGDNSIVNADSIDAAGNLVLGEDAYIGGGSVIQENLEVDGDISGGSDIISEGDIVSEGNIFTDGDIVAEEGNVVAEDAFLENAGMRASTGVFHQEVIDAPGSVDFQGNCGDGLEPRIFTSIQSVIGHDAGNGATAIHGIRTIVDGGGGSYQITPQVIGPETNSWQNTEAQVVVMMACGPN